MSDYETMLICALRYALGRRTYIVGIVVDYIISEMPNLSEKCKRVMILDINNPFGGYGDECDKKNWMRLLKELEGHHFTDADKMGKE